MIQDAPIRFAQIAAAGLGALFSAWALRRALKGYREVHEDVELEELQPAAVRRVRQQAFTLLKQFILVVVGLLTLSPALTTDEIMSVRGFAMLVLSLILLLRSALEHWEQRASDRSPWDGKDRRHSQ
jgi:hypothetical protein